MQKLHLVGFTTDHDGLIFAARRGARSGSFVVPLGDDVLEALEEAQRLRAEELDDAADADARPARPESALTVKEVQSRLRAGRTIDDVAGEAGVDPGWVARFAAPVIAEQAQVIAALRNTVLSRPRLGPSIEPLGVAVYRALAERGVHLTEEEMDEGWATYQLYESRWIVEYRYELRGKASVVSWEFDQSTGEVVAADRFSGQVAYVAPSAPAAGRMAQARRAASHRAPIRTVAPRPARVSKTTLARKIAASKKAAAARDAEELKREAAAAKKAEAARRAEEARKLAAAKRQAAADREAARRAAIERAAAQKAELARRAAEEKRLAAERKAAEEAAARKAEEDQRKADAKAAATERKRAAAARKRAAATKRAAAARKRAATERKRAAAAAKKAAPAKKAAKPAAKKSATGAATRPTKKAAKATKASRSLRVTKKATKPAAPRAFTSAPGRTAAPRAAASVARPSPRVRAVMPAGEAPPRIRSIDAARADRDRALRRREPLRATPTFDELERIMSPESDEPPVRATFREGMATSATDAASGNGADPAPPRGERLADADSGRSRRRLRPLRAR